ncbi:hypothetical protein [Salininema proteolyticum]|uniref:Uncharacterized protein n=1 Tax=Salininema proteolyticum TaxID=1607685 RepID=A0ABV8TTC8_9ACTN
MSDYEPIVDLSDAPGQRAEWGVGDGEGLFNGSLEENVVAAGGYVPVAGPVVKAAVAISNTTDSWSRLFEGEASRQDLFAVATNILDVVNEVAGLVGELKGLANQDYLGMLASWVVGTQLEFLTKNFQPVEDAYGYVVGNPGRLKTAGAMWKEAASALDSLAEGYREVADETIHPAWEGHTGAGAITRSQDFIDAISVTGGVATQLGSLVEVYADFSTRLIDLFNQIITNLVAAIFDALKDVATKGWGAAVTAAIDIQILIIQVVVQLTAIILQAIQIFMMGKDITEKLEEVFDDMMELMGLLTDA